VNTSILDEVEAKVSTPVITAYSYTWPDKKKKKDGKKSDIDIAVEGLIEDDGSIVLWNTKYKEWKILPLNYNEAKQVIIDKQLKRRYHATSGSYVFLDDAMNELYIDHWDRFDKYEYTQ
jgi:hypothetical protein